MAVTSGVVLMTKEDTTGPRNTHVSNDKGPALARRTGPGSAGATQNRPTLRRGQGRCAQAGVLRECPTGEAGPRRPPGAGRISLWADRGKAIRSPETSAGTSSAPTRKMVSSFGWEAI